MVTTQTINFCCWDMLITIHPEWPLRGRAAEREGRVMDVTVNRPDNKLLKEKDSCLYFAVRLCALQPSPNGKLDKTTSQSCTYKAVQNTGGVTARRASAHTVHSQLSGTEEVIIRTASIPPVLKVYCVVDGRHKNCWLASSDISWQQHD